MFGLSIQLYESTLIANDTRVDQFLEGNTTALSADEQAGMAIFTGPGKCIACHGGPELTNASVRNLTNDRLERMHMGNGGIAVYDNGFYNIATRPTGDDPGVGGSIRSATRCRRRATASSSSTRARPARSRTRTPAASS